MKKIIEAIVKTFMPSLLDLIVIQFSNIFRKIKPADKLATVLQTLYVIVDKELEEIAKTTETDKDDIAVAGLKKAIENVAKENDITLLNADND